MLVRTILPFRDLAEGVDRALNEEFDVSEARFAAINATSYGTLVVAVEQPEASEDKPRKKAAPKKKAKAEEE